MLQTDVSDRVATIEMRSGKVNAMSLAFVSALSSTINDLAVDPSVEALLLTGNGRVFSAGIDLKQLTSEPADWLDEFLPLLSHLFVSALNFPKPLVTLINGHAVAGGCVLACTGDLRLIAGDARIGVPELRVGVPFPPAGMEIMRWAAAPSNFRRMIQAGATFTGAEAVPAGLADEVCDRDQMRVRAQAAIREMAQVPADVFALTKRQMRHFVNLSIREHREAFGAEIDGLWRDSQTRRSIEHYVRDRLN